MLPEMCKGYEKKMFSSYHVRNHGKVVSHQNLLQAFSLKGQTIRSRTILGHHSAKKKNITILMTYKYISCIKMISEIHDLVQ